MTIFKDSHHFREQSLMKSLKTAITSAELWAVFDDNLSRQPSLQQNFRQCLITMFNDSAFFERTLRGRFREKSELLRTALRLLYLLDGEKKKHPNEEHKPMMVHVNAVGHFQKRFLARVLFTMHKPRNPI